MSASEIRERLALTDIKTHSWRIQPCSAITGENLIEGLDWAVKDVGSRIYFYGTSEVNDGRAGVPVEGAKEAEAEAVSKVA